VITIRHDEQAEIDAATHDGEGWALQGGIPEDVRARLEEKGLIRFWMGRWQLTPVGFSYSRMFEGR